MKKASPGDQPFPLSKSDAITSPRPKSIPLVSRETLPSPSRLDIYSTSQRKYSCCGGWLYNRACKSAIRLPCKRWDCSQCVRKKGGDICRRAKMSGNLEKWTRVMTLPFALSQKRNWRQAIEESGAVLNRFLSSLRKCFRNLTYFWTREIGKKSNMVHFHVLINTYLPKSLVSGAWAKAGGGSVVDIHAVRKSTTYVFKYLMKVPNYAPNVMSALAGKRRYSTSQGALAPRVVQKLLGEWHFLSVAVGCSKVVEGRWRVLDGTIYTCDPG